MAANQVKRVDTTIPPPPYKKMDDLTDEGHPVFAWDLSKDECAHLSKLFGRDFSEANVGGTYVTCPPKQCGPCGKWTEFIDWVYTALKRDVHSTNFLFNALKNRQYPKENRHDVYCSGCGALTHLRSHDNAEGGAPHIIIAGALRYDNEKVAVSEVNGWVNGDWIYDTHKVSVTVEANADDVKVEKGGFWKSVMSNFTRTVAIKHDELDTYWAYPLDWIIPSDEMKTPSKAEDTNTENYWAYPLDWVILAAEAEKTEHNIDMLIPVSEAKTTNSGNFWIPSIPWLMPADGKMVGAADDI